MKTVSLKLSDSLEAELSATARETARTKSAVVREALTAFLNDKKKAGQGSCLELAEDLAGAVQGPRDLSFGKKHMDGYGK